ncbi:hypothetical protein BN424_2151 [Carnobacterium maltaromaticum LMA28]|uniref:Uncharacterized protein n=1 Tax=Carnobacterium maltaromaticum LMA28 TaxID=1234679 RepID=K8ESM6_CARML|nr:hypothetical protein [Carnobacterium maltaromaticum]CCO11591.2 hypothetical protein BN424_2151 [Carnobacterium maltaromaticum LMA28]
MSDVKSFRSQSDYSQEQVIKMIDFADEQNIPLFDVMKRVEKLMFKDMTFDEAFNQELGAD